MRDYERLLTGGIWAQVDLRFEYDEETKGKYPFWIERLMPIQIATFDLDDYQRTARGVHDRRVAGPDAAQHGLRARGHGPADEAATS